MPHQRKVHTRSTRFQIAAEAARIIATEGQQDFHTAKRKAADRIGSSDRLALPSNQEVQDALLSYQALYGGQQHTRNLEKLRLAAIEAMRQLAAYSPRLVGPVLDGSAGSHARITLHVFCDQPETLVHDFLQKGLPFRQEQKRLRLRDRDYQFVPVLLLEISGNTIELMVFNPISQRQAPPCPIDGKPQQRASIADVEKLLGINTSAA